MRLNDDDKRVLAAIFHGADAASVGVSDKQVIAAYKTLRTLGFIDIGGALTQRGRHVAKSLPFEKVKNVEFQRQDRAGVDRKSRSRYRGRDQAEASDRDCESRKGSDVEASNRSDESGGCDVSDLSGADTVTEPEPGTVCEAPSIPSGCDADCG